jgi:hypothetical protein
VNTLRVLSPWTQVGTTRAGKPKYRPQVLLDHPQGPGESCLTATGKAVGAAPPSPNVHVAELVVSDARLAALQADLNYAGVILWVDTIAPPDQPPTSQEADNLQAALDAQTSGLVHVSAPAIDPSATRGDNEATITAWTQRLG